MQTYVNTPQAPEGVTLSDRDDPQPGPGEVVIAVEATSVNRGELALLPLFPEGWRPGWDVAGTVVQPAADGSGPPVGARVAALPAQGAWAERVAVPTDRVGVIPDRVPFAAAATLPVSGGTALKTIRLGGDLLGQPVLITGAGGAVGRFQIQLAALAGAEVTAVAAPRHHERLLELGAAAVVPETAAAPGGFKLVTDALGGPNLEQAIGQVAPGGTVVMFGMSTPQPASIGLGMFRGGHENARLQNFSLDASAQGLGTDLALLGRLVASGRLQIDIAQEWPFDQLPAALDALRARAVAGKAVVHVSRN